jgi:hypothetical protein
MSQPHDAAKCLAASLLGLAALGAAGAAASEPYQVEVLVFARPAGEIDLTEPNDHQPGCLARAQPPSAAPGAPGAPWSVGRDRFQLGHEAQALERPGAGMQILAHGAWQQEVPATASGPWIRIGDRAGRALKGCLRVRLTPVPEIEIDLVYESASGNRHSLFGTAQIRPGDVHYFDHPALGTLVRLDTLAPTGAGATGLPVGITPATSAPPAAAPAPPPPTLAPAAPEAPPPPPKKPFRW